MSGVLPTLCTSRTFHVALKTAVGIGEADMPPQPATTSKLFWLRLCRAVFSAVKSFCLHFFDYPSALSSLVAHFAALCLCVSLPSVFSALKIFLPPFFCLLFCSF